MNYFNVEPLQSFVNAALYAGGVIAIVLIFAWRQPRREKFGLRVFLGIFIVIAVAEGMAALFNHGVPMSSAWYIRFQIVRFIAIFSLSGVLVSFCFKCKLWECVFFMVTGYCVQHISARANEIFHTFILTDLPWQWSSFAGCLFNAVVYALFYLFYARRHLHEATISISDRTMLITALCVVGVSIVYGPYATSHALRVMTHSDKENGSKLLMFVYVMTAIIASLAFMLCVSSNKMKYYAEETQTLVKLLDDKRARYEQDKLNVELINMRLHDLKHYIGSLTEQDFVACKDEILENIVKYDAGFNSGNDALDTLFTNKSMQCAEKEIRFNAMIAGVKFADIPKFELYTIFCNAIDNAIEAVEKLPPEKRIISITAAPAGQKVAVLIENYFDGNARFVDGLPLSDKGGKLHGWGVKSIKMLVEKYGGTFKVEVCGDIFSVSIIL